MLNAQKTRLAAVLVLVGAALLVGGSLLPAGPEGGDRPNPSYADLDAQLRLGEGRGDEDDGVFEIYQFHRPDPAAWIWFRVDPQTGERTETEIRHDSFVEPPKGEEIPTHYKRVEDHEPESLGALIEWIVDTYEHVKSASELTVVE